MSSGDTRPHPTPLKGALRRVSGTVPGGGGGGGGLAGS